MQSALNSMRGRVCFIISSSGDFFFIIDNNTTLNTIERRKEEEWQIDSPNILIEEQGAGLR